MKSLSFREYLVFTVYLWLAYALAYLPFAIYVWKLSAPQLLAWLLSGLPVSLVANYPIAKGLTKLERRLSKH